jgi:hypothetical protein
MATDGRGREAIRLMAILNDLTKETSFRRFYLRWLVACWLPVALVVAIWVSAIFLGSTKASFALRFSLPLQFWALVGIGQWRFLRRYSDQAGRWAVRTVVGGGIATLIWIFQTAILTRTPIEPLSMIGVYMSVSLKLPKSLVLLTPVLVMGFGFAIAFMQNRLLTQNRGDRRMWMMFNGGSAAILFVSLEAPLHLALVSHNLKIMNLDLADLASVIPTYPMTTLPIVLLVFWLSYSALIGLFLWAMRRRQTWRDGRLFQVFE